MLAAREPSPLDLQSATPSQSPPQPKQRKRRTKMVGQGLSGGLQLAPLDKRY